MAMTIDELRGKRDYSTEEILFVVERYVLDRKGKVIHIIPPTNMRDVIILDQLFNTAMNYYESN